VQVVLVLVLVLVLVVLAAAAAAAAASRDSCARVAQPAPMIRALVSAGRWRQPCSWWLGTEV